MTDWREIGSCPDNVPVVFFNGKDVIPGRKYARVIGPFKADAFHPVDRPARLLVDFEDFMDADRDGGYGDVYPAPTHWAPLPEPPYVVGIIDGEATEVIEMKALA